MDISERRTTGSGSAHSESAAAVLASLGTDPTQGLDQLTADARLRAEGRNEIEESGGRSIWQIIFAQFSSIVVWLLIVAAAVALFTESVVEAAAIAVVLLLNALIGFAIEWQANRSLAALRRSARTMSRVRRGGEVSVIDSSLIVRGDIIVLTSGDRVPADARLIEAVNLSADESTLTGESVPVEKSVAEVELSTPLAERRSMLYLGTNVVNGRALALVTATGRATELGRIGKMLAGARDKTTPLERRLAELGTRLVYIVLGVAVIVMLAGLARGDEWGLMARVAISLAVAAVPEGLPAVTTLILALGVLRMARRSAIVRHLAAVETLGSTTVICTDKTGTLTENRMTVEECMLADGRSMVSDTDARTETRTGNDVLARLLRVAVLCNEAEFSSLEKAGIGDPTETALLAAAAKFGIDVAAERARYTKLREIPFESATKRMTAVFADPEKQQWALVKGAPSVVLESSSWFMGADQAPARMDAESKKHFLDLNDQMAARGLRVLAFADQELVDADPDPPDSGYTFLGYMGMTDPPRAGAQAAVREASNAGIRVVMLTGDQVLTAESIARRLGLSKDHDVVSLHSRDLAEANDKRLSELAKTAHVFARVTPEDKLKIVRALQWAGEVVAVTGDGVNDAPALKQADIGIAFGERGTDVAKEAADVVLTDDNFSTIVQAIEGGRTIYANIVKFVHLMFSHNFGEVLVIFAAIVAGLPLPLLPLQILWINLVTDIFPALALAVEPATEQTMKRPPRSPKEAILSKGFIVLIAWQGAMLAAVTLAAYIWALSVYGEGAHSRTVALLALTGVQLGHLFNCRSRTRSAFSRFFSNPFIFVAVGVVIALQVIAVYFSPLASVLGLANPNANDLLVVGASFVIPIAIVEIAKAVARIWKPDPRRSPG